ncbi:MAG: Cys-tRNA(Pro) deacylase [Synechococcales bacterium]|nr:Cys-tRNA(Pro) deacylase [Synechococcales bacterium]
MKPSSRSGVKTNAARVLDRLQVAYEVLSYEVDPDDLAASTAAAKLGLPLEQVFKTLVVQGDRQGICLAVIPADAELDLKALAHLSGNRNVETVPLKQVQPLTGYIRGGVTAIACKKDYPVFVDASAQGFDQFAVSAGKRGLMLWLSPRDYLTVVQGMSGAIARPRTGSPAAKTETPEA